MKLSILLLASVGIIMHNASAQQKINTSFGSVNRATPKFGFNTNGHIPANFPIGTSGANWTQQWFIDSTVYLNPEILRYPGGTNANHWDWKTGWYVPAYLPPSGPTMSIRVDEFKPGIKGCNGEGLYVLNMETSNAHYEMDGLRHANSIGLNPKLIELGNEHNLPGGTTYPIQLMTPANYSILAKEYYDSLKIAFPTAKICAVGGNTPAIQHWVDSVLKYVPNIDAISFHVYLNANNTDLKFNVNRALAVPFGIASNNNSLLYRYNNSGFNTLNPTKEVWVTEFNLLESASGTPAVISQTWTHVLYNTAMNHFFLGKSNVTMVLNHSLAGDNHFQSISRQDKKITANALSMKLLYDMARGSNTCKDIAFAGNPSITSGSSTIPKLVGWKFEHSGIDKGFICNFSRDTFAVSLLSIFPNPMQFDQYYADTALKVNGLSSLNKYSGNSKDVITVYPYSITQIISAIVTGKEEITLNKNALRMYPNPTQNELMVQTESDLIRASVNVYDMHGREVLQLQNINGKSFSISISNLSSGHYVLKIQGENNVISGNFLVE